LASKSITRQTFNPSASPYSYQDSDLAARTCRWASQTANLGYPSNNGKQETRKLYTVPLPHIHEDASASGI
jgi:hypothetical protein